MYAYYVNKHSHEHSVYVEVESKPEAKCASFISETLLEPPQIHQVVYKNCLLCETSFMEGAIRDHLCPYCWHSMNDRLCKQCDEPIPKDKKAFCNMNCYGNFLRKDAKNST